MSGRLGRMRRAVPAGVAAAIVGLALCSAAAAAAAPGTPSTSTVESAPGPDIRDIRGPKFSSPSWLLPSVLAAAVLLASSAYAIWRWRRRRQRTPTPSPFEIALQRLEDIRVLMLPANAAEFSVMVSDIVRRYIEQRFEVIATRRTTEEFLHDLLESSHASLARHRALLGKFLHLCDFVKFGGLSLNLQNMESLRQSARSFVLATAGETRDSLPST